MNQGLKTKLKLFVKRIQRLQSNYQRDLLKIEKSDNSSYCLIHESYNDSFNKSIEVFCSHNGVRIYKKGRYRISIVNNEIHSNLAKIISRVRNIKSRALNKLAKAAKKKNQKFPLDMLIDSNKIPEDLREIKFVE